MATSQRWDTNQNNRLTNVGELKRNKLYKELSQKGF